MGAPCDIELELTPRRPLFTVAGLARYLNVSERTVRALLAAGELPSYKLAGVRRIDPVDVDAWMAKGKAAGPATPGG